MKLRKGGDKWLYRNMVTESVSLCVEFYPFIVSLEFIEGSPYRRRVVTIKSGGIEKIRNGKGNPNYWMKSIFEDLDENKGEGAGNEIT
jgi:hypothetical protein